MDLELVRCQVMPHRYFTGINGAHCPRVFVPAEQLYNSAWLHGIGEQFGMGSNFLLLFFKHESIMENYLCIQKVRS